MHIDTLRHYVQRPLLKDLPQPLRATIGQRPSGRYSLNFKDRDGNEHAFGYYLSERQARRIAAAESITIEEAGSQTALSI
jgi:hypothetical protein